MPAADLENLPHDAYRLLAVPSPVGGVLVVCANSIHYHSQSVSCALALNDFAMSTESRSLRFQFALTNPLNFHLATLLYLHSLPSYFWWSHCNIPVSQLGWSLLLSTSWNCYLEFCYPVKLLAECQPGRHEAAFPTPVLAIRFAVLFLYLLAMIGSSCSALKPP
eukprot:Gb_25539 [translate_table: standard]